jgi:hypothetical protein
MQTDSLYGRDHAGEGHDAGQHQKAETGGCQSDTGQHFAENKKKKQGLHEGRQDKSGKLPAGYQQIAMKDGSECAKGKT